VVHGRVIQRIVKLFDCPIIQNDLRGMYVESMVAELLGNDWQNVGQNWAGWDLEHTDGTKLEVKQSSAKQAWSPSARGYSAPKFSIRTPSVFWTGAEATPADGRLAHIYIFAWHGITSESADHRDPQQWEFFVVPTSALPMQESIRSPSDQEDS